jgi:hypothetical protein
MIQKFTPLIILGLFILGTIFVIWGMEKASKLANPKKVEIKFKKESLSV